MALMIRDASKGRVEVSFAQYDESPFCPATCQECNQAFDDMPAGFIRFELLAADEAPAGILRDGGGAWVTAREVAPEAGKAYQGYCGTCADILAALDHAEYVNGGWDRRNIEDEMYVWKR